MRKLTNMSAEMNSPRESVSDTNDNDQSTNDDDNDNDKSTDDNELSTNDDNNHQQISQPENSDSEDSQDYKKVVIQPTRITDHPGIWKLFRFLVSSQEVYQFITNCKVVLIDYPTGLKNNCQFVLKNSSTNTGPRQVYFDDCGSWDLTRKAYHIDYYMKKKFIIMYKRGGKYFWKKQNSGTAAYVLIEPQPTDEMIIRISRHQVFHKLDKNFIRRVSRVFDEQNPKISERVLYQYKGYQPLAGDASKATRTETTGTRFTWTSPMTLKNPPFSPPTNDMKITSENLGNKREASATVTTAEIQGPPPSKTLRRHYEGMSSKQRESSEPVSIVEVDQTPKERPAPKLSLPETKVTFQTAAPIPPTQHRKMLIVSEHQRNVMTCLASLWKKGLLCDAGIGNGTTIVMVHKIVLLAVCPKLLTMFNSSGQSNRFLQVNFPQTISHEALSSFAEYIYNGVLDLSTHLLSQLQQMALQLGMKELELLCATHLTPQNVASMTIKNDLVERPPAPFDSIQIVNFKTNDVIFPQQVQSTPAQLVPLTNNMLTSNFYQHLVITPPQILLNKEVNKNSLGLSPSLDESLQYINNPNNKFDEISNLPADIPNTCNDSLGFETPSGERPISISNIKTEPINIDDDSCDPAEIYPHNAPTASPADVLTTNYSSLVDQMQEQRHMGSSSHKRKSRSTVNSVKYSSEDEVHDTGWQDVSFTIHKAEDFDQPASSDKDNIDTDSQPFPVELISVVRSRKSSLQSAPD